MPFLSGAAKTAVNPSTPHNFPVHWRDLRIEVFSSEQWPTITVR